MLFNSFEFAFFFALVFSLYIFSPHKLQNWVLLFSSYFFYGCWDYRFLSLIWISTIVDYICGLKIEEHQDSAKRKLYLGISIAVNIGILGFFKYFNFFADSFMGLASHFGWTPDLRTLNIVLPVGISFYTFQTLSYSIDIYYKKLKPTKNLLDFSVFVAFFPQLVAGPIERASHLLPQVSKKRQISFDQIKEGSFLIFWGLFIKVFIADHLAEIVNPIFASSSSSGAEVLVACYAFAFQIYCDFSGYSNIARGLAKCLGFDIMVNFNLPYFATNPQEFWKRWHISLSTWLRDYLYIPLGGSKFGKWLTFRNLSVTMLLGGLWHGASWTFVIWGAFHGLILVIHRQIKTIKREDRDRNQNLFKKIPSIIFFFHVTCVGWLIFRAQSFDQLVNLSHSLIFNMTGAGLLSALPLLAKMLFFCGILIVAEVIQYKRNDLLAIYKSPVLFRYFFYVVCIMLLILFRMGNAQEFIYFQF